ncbi:MAG TPA: carboxypeptidase M32 [Bacteroidia bacterium]|jgi:carboxypeptidase Taq|nr:carboxypeptidase M32 [Bacteroidia bacterium]
MTPYDQYIETLRRIADINFTSAVLGWDQETYMPEGSAATRAQQLSTLAGLSHQMSTTDELGKLLEELNKDNSLDEAQKANVKQTLKDYTKAKKYTTAFVEEMSKTISESFSAWQSAKAKNDFSLFAPKLKKLVELKRKECELLGYKEHPYDALLDLHEPGLTTKDVEKLFVDVRGQLVPFVKLIAAKPGNSNEILHIHYPKDKQWEFSIHLLKQMGFDFNIGRQDISVHPFTTSFSSQDVRVTTRIDENNLSDCVTGTIHEGGHALYEQGLPVSSYGLPSGEAVSLGIHESQSRLWENNVGRSLEFWKGQFAELQKYFPQQLKNKTTKDLFTALNVVKPNLIRINADELTYHSHIMIRFEVERAIFSNELEVENIPAFWNKKYKDYLGLDVPSDSEGCMQDVHWSHGSFGYFPTYSLGSFYAAQFFAKAKKDIPELEKEIENGNFSSLLKWLRENIHQYGKRFGAKDLCKRVTGEELNFSHFMDYAKEKYGMLYGI